MGRSSASEKPEKPPTRKDYEYNLCFNIAQEKVERGDTDFTHTFPPAASKQQPTVSDFWLQGVRLIIWAPHLFFGWLMPRKDSDSRPFPECPYCGGCLASDGWAPKLREVIGWTKRTLVLQYKYRCENRACKAACFHPHKCAQAGNKPCDCHGNPRRITAGNLEFFQGVQRDPASNIKRGALPPVVANMYPVVLGGKYGFTSEVYESLRWFVRNSVAFSKFRKQMDDLHHDQYYKDLESYLSVQQLGVAVGDCPSYHLVKRPPVQYKAPNSKGQQKITDMYEKRPQSKKPENVPAAAAAPDTDASQQQQSAPAATPAADAPQQQQSAPASSPAPQQQPATGPSGPRKTQVERFGPFDGDYGGFMPGAANFVTIYLSMEKNAIAWMTRSISNTGGRFWKADHSFKLTKFIRLADGQRLYGAVFTIMQEDGKVVWWRKCEGKSWEELKEPLREHVEYLKSRGVQLPEWVYLDDCEHGGDEFFAQVLEGTSFQGCKQDHLHVLFRFGEAMPDEDPVRGRFLGELSWTLRPAHDPDLRMLQQLLAKKPYNLQPDQIRAKPMKFLAEYCRRFTPELGVLLPAIRALQLKYQEMSDARVSSGGDVFMTHHMDKAFTSLFALVEKGRLQYPCPVDEMYSPAKQWPPAKLTDMVRRYYGDCTHLEGFHGAAYRAALKSTSTSEELADMIINSVIFAWNYYRDVEAGREQVLTLERGRVESIQLLSQQLKDPNPWPTILPVVNVPVDRFNTQQIMSVDIPACTAMPEDSDEELEGFQECVQPDDEYTPLQPALVNEQATGAQQEVSLPASAQPGPVQRPQTQPRRFAAVLRTGGAAARLPVAAATTATTTTTPPRPTGLPALPAAAPVPPLPPPAAATTAQPGLPAGQAPLQPAPLAVAATTAQPGLPATQAPLQLAPLAAGAAAPHAGAAVAMQSALQPTTQGFQHHQAGGPQRGGAGGMLQPGATGILAADLPCVPLAGQQQYEQQVTAMPNFPAGPSSAWQMPVQPAVLQQMLMLQQMQQQLPPQMQQQVMQQMMQQMMQQQHMQQQMMQMQVQQMPQMQVQQVMQMPQMQVQQVQQVQQMPQMQVQQNQQMPQMPQMACSTGWLLGQGQQPVAHPVQFNGGQLLHSQAMQQQLQQGVQPPSPVHQSKKSRN